MDNDIERLALEWYKARAAFLVGPTVRDPASKLPTLVNPELFSALGAAENALAVECRAVLEQRQSMEKSDDKRPTTT